MKHYGATLDEWLHFSLALGLTGDMLPVVSNPDAEISPQSKMKSAGKTPSLYNRSGHAVGISQWTQKIATDDEVTKWSQQPDYGICIQTRSVRALDCDILDPSLAKEVHYEIDKFLGQRLPCRSRDGASKFLLALEMPGDYQKRTITTQGGVIEFLATGQQFVAVGHHVSGTPYLWAEGLPDTIPIIDSEQFEKLWYRLAECFAIEPPTVEVKSSKQATLNEAIQNDPVAQHLYAKSVVLSAERDGRLHITCPFAGEHTADSAESGTTYFPARTGGFERGNFKCLHAHCEKRTRADFLTALDYEESFDDFDIVVAQDGADTSTDTARYVFEPPAVFKQRAPPSWVVKSVLPCSALAVVFGDSGSGKTFLCLDLALAVARGVEWRGLRCKQGSVAYIAAEDATGLRHRCEAYYRHHELNSDDIPFYVLADTPNFTKAADVKDVMKALRLVGPVSVIFVDTWAQVTPGANENSGEDMGAALSHCRALHKATGALVVLIHHSGKDASKGARGWSGLRAAADAEIEVTRSDDAREAQITKQKNATDGARYGFKLVTVPIGQDEDGDPITSCTVDHVAAPAARMAKAKPLNAKAQGVFNTFALLAGATQGGTVGYDDLAAAYRQSEAFDGDKTHIARHVRAAMKAIEDKGWAAQAAGGWCLTREG